MPCSATEAERSHHHGAFESWVEDQAEKVVREQAAEVIVDGDALQQVIDDGLHPRIGIALARVLRDRHAAQRGSIPAYESVFKGLDEIEEAIKVAYADDIWEATVRDIDRGQK